MGLFSRLGKTSKMRNLFGPQEDQLPDRGADQEQPLFYAGEGEQAAPDKIDKGIDETLQTMNPKMPDAETMKAINDPTHGLNIPAKPLQPDQPPEQSPYPVPLHPALLGKPADQKNTGNEWWKSMNPQVQVTELEKKTGIKAPEEDPLSIEKRKLTQLETDLRFMDNSLIGEGAKVVRDAPAGIWNAAKGGYAAGANLLFGEGTVKAPDGVASPSAAKRDQLQTEIQKSRQKIADMEKTGAAPGVTTGPTLEQARGTPAPTPVAQPQVDDIGQMPKEIADAIFPAGVWDDMQRWRQPTSADTLQPQVKVPPSGPGGAYVAPLAKALNQQPDVMAKGMADTEAHLKDQMGGKDSVDTKRAIDLIHGVDPWASDEFEARVRLAEARGNAPGAFTPASIAVFLLFALARRPDLGFQAIMQMHQVGQEPVKQAERQLEHVQTARAQDRMGQRSDARKMAMQDKVLEGHMNQAAATNNMHEKVKQMELAWDMMKEGERNFDEIRKMRIDIAKAIATNSQFAEGNPTLKGAIDRLERLNGEMQMEEMRKRPAGKGAPK